MQYQDTIVIPQPRDTVQADMPLPESPDSSLGYLNPVPISISVPRASIPVLPQATDGASLETPSAASQQVTEKWNTSGNFLKDNGLAQVFAASKSTERQSTPLFHSTEKPAGIVPVQRMSATNDWLLGIFIFLVVLFVWIRIFYNKFFALLANALISFQVSAKLLQERNVLLQRVSIVLNFIYLLVFSVFIYELADYLGLAGTSIRGFKFFLLLLNVLILYTLFRIVMLHLTGELFLIRSLFSEYRHHIFVINKGAGIVLFPVVIMAHYMPHTLIPVMLIIGTVIYAVSFLLKSIRIYQIIIRRDILLFYLILYLCTLEILPLLLGYKFVTLLTQSN